MQVGHPPGQREATSLFVLSTELRGTRTKRSLLPTPGDDHTRCWKETSHPAGLASSNPYCGIHGNPVGQRRGSMGISHLHVDKVTNYFLKDPNDLEVSTVVHCGRQVKYKIARPVPTATNTRPDPNHSPSQRAEIESPVLTSLKLCSGPHVTADKAEFYFDPR